MARVRRRWLTSACLLAGFAGLLAAPARTQPAGRVVYVVPIDGTIDLGLAPLLARAIRQAQEANADAVLLEINTFGGRVDAAVAMRDALLGSQVRTIAFVNQRAISAGALIALATHTLVMTSGGTIGAAMPVLGGTGESQPADEKTVSYLRKEFRATAETRGRPPVIAEAMVDADVEIPGLVAAGKLLTLTTREAMQHKVADFTADSLDAALQAAGLAGARVDRFSQTWAETIVRFLTGPIVSSLLLTIGLLGLLVEIRTPGFGLAGAAGLLSLAAFFWGHWIVQLAGWEELLLVIAGITLLGLEAFALPGFGLAGVFGIVLLIAGLAMALVGAGATVAIVIGALGRVAAAILLAMGGALALMRFLPKLPFGRRLILATDLPAAEGYESTPDGDRHWLGRTGIARSPLRPAGIAEFDGSRVDVVSDGSFIEPGTTIEVVQVEGNRIVVRRRAAQGVT